MLSKQTNSTSLKIYLNICTKHASLYRWCPFTDIFRVWWLCIIQFGLLHTSTYIYNLTVGSHIWERNFKTTKFDHFNFSS